MRDVRRLRFISEVLVATSAAWMSACGDGFETQGQDDWTISFWDSANDALPEAELDARAAYARTPIAIEGTVVDRAGAPIAGATLTLGGLTTQTHADGRFRLDGAVRHNRLLWIEAPGFRREYAAPQLALPVSIDAVDVGVVPLHPVDPAVTRFMFAGDVALGRRFLDPDGSTPRDQVPPDDPMALISVADPAPGSRAAVQFIKDVFLEADVRVVNLESVVTDNPATPHPTKAYCFFTLPGSLVALAELGVRYVGLGNNHMFDYLDQGVVDTLGHLEAVGVAYSGVGATPAEAFAPHVETIAGTPYAFVSMTSVSGSEHAIGYVASASQGGAADLRDDDGVATAIGDARAAGQVVIAELHQGQEYTFEPSSFSQERLAFVAASGAHLIIAHHPHVAQGFGFIGGVLAVHSLGNFAFDSERLETMWSLIARLDLRGATVEHATAVPVYLEDFRPRVMTAAASARFLRRIGEFSRDYGAHAHVDGPWLRVTAEAAAWRANTATVRHELVIPASGELIIDLRELASPGASLVALRGAGLTAELGRDVLLYGDFEDGDVDDDTLELARWDVSGSYAFACLDGARRGAASLCLRASSSQTLATSVALRNRVRVMGDAADTPFKNLTFVGYAAFDNAGPITVRADYSASEGDADLGSEVIYTHPGGDQAWAMFAVPMNMPADTVPSGPTINARAARLFVRQAPPTASGGAMARFDDLAIVGWERPAPVDGTALPSPHAYDFIRVRGAPGAHVLELDFQTVAAAR